MKKKTTKNTKNPKFPIYVIGYDPINDLAGVGGFNWFYKREDALEHFKWHFVEDTYMVWFRVHKVAVKGDTLKEWQEEITANIQENILDNGAEGDWK